MTVFITLLLLFSSNDGCSGYMSPEYALDGILSIKLDVFSFGVLVLEIISGKRNKGFYQSEPHSNLIRYVSARKNSPFILCRCKRLSVGNHGSTCITRNCGICFRLGSCGRKERASSCWMNLWRTCIALQKS